MVKRYGIWMFVIAGVVGFGLYYWKTYATLNQELDNITHISPTLGIRPSPTTAPSITVPSEEKQNIDTWIAQNDLNEYGDAKGTVYAGGTPLFNEATGKTMDRYEYIVRNHPDRPWDK